jgi:hypothetical protein
MYLTEGVVVFYDGASSHWLMKYLQAGFKHCFVCIKYGDHYIVVNGMHSHNDLEIVEKIEDIAPDHAKIVYFKAEIDDNVYRGTLCWFNCVEVVKAHMGIKSFWCWTPYQLYKLLNRSTRDG